MQYVSNMRWPALGHCAADLTRAEREATDCLEAIEVSLDVHEATLMNKWPEKFPLTREHEALGPQRKKPKVRLITVAERDDVLCFC